MRTRTFEVFQGSTKTLEYYVKDRNGEMLDATNVYAVLYDEEITFSYQLGAKKLAVGVYSVTIDTSALGLEEGKYIIEFRCIAGGTPYVRRDILYVRMFT